MTGRTPGKSTFIAALSGVMTNGTYLTQGNETDAKSAPVLRKFVIIAEYKDQVWAEAQNGQYAGEMLTFFKNQLYPITAS